MICVCLRANRLAVVWLFHFVFLVAYFAIRSDHEHFQFFQYQSKLWRFQLKAFASTNPNDRRWAKKKMKDRYIEWGRCDAAWNRYGGLCNTFDPFGCLVMPVTGLQKVLKHQSPHTHGLTQAPSRTSPRSKKKLKRLTQIKVRCYQSPLQCCSELCLAVSTSLRPWCIL